MTVQNTATLTAQDLARGKPRERKDQDFQVNHQGVSVAINGRFTWPRTPASGVAGPGQSVERAPFVALRLARRTPAPVSMERASLHAQMPGRRARVLRTPTGCEKRSLLRLPLASGPLASLAN